jgi:recombination protein RecA
MAKKKDAEEVEVKANIVDELVKKYGQGIIQGASGILDKKREILSFSPSADINLGGGIPSGSTVIISGPQKIGKTTAVLGICREAQKQGKKVFYSDIEARLKIMNLRGIEGLDLSEEKFQVIRSQPGKILQAEEHLSILERIILTEENCVVVMDSSSALCSESEMTGEISGQLRNLGPKLLANFCRKVGNAIPVHNITMLVIQHLINDTSGKGHGGKLEDGGVKIQYQQDVKIRGLYKEDWTIGSGEKQEIIGQKVHWKLITGALPGNMPNSEFTTYLRYGVGMDRLAEYINLGVDLGLIQKTEKGGWFTFGEMKLQGDKFYQAIKADETLYQTLLDGIKAITG